MFSLIKNFDPKTTVMKIEECYCASLDEFKTHSIGRFDPIRKRHSFVLPGLDLKLPEIVTLRDHFNDLVQIWNADIKIFLKPDHIYFVSFSQPPDPEMLLLQNNNNDYSETPKKRIKLDNC